MKYKFYFLLFIFLLSNICFATQEWNEKEFIHDIKTYKNDYFPELFEENWLSDVINRKYKN